MAAIAVLFAFLPPQAAPVHAAPGDLDPTFAGFADGGITAPELSKEALALQPDGKIVVAGPTSGDLVVRRYLPDAQPDPSFGGDGEVVHDNFPDPIVPLSAAIQTDGKIVVVGYDDDPQRNSDYWVARLMPNGALDPSFNGNGWVLTDFNGFGGLSPDIGTSLLIQPDGKIIVGGYSYTGDNSNDFSAARYLPNGSLDASFDGDGKVIFGFGGLGDDRCYDIALQGDGKLVMVGANEGELDTDFALGRLHPNGSLDSSFDDDGKKQVSFGDDELALAVAIQTDGKIVVTGRTSEGDTSDEGRMARLFSDGSLDGSFDGDGKLVLNNNGCHDMLIQTDGKIVVAGFHESPDFDGKVAFHRLLSNGAFDPSLGGGGAMYIDLGSPGDRAHKIAIQPDGRLIALCLVDVGARLLRVWPDGSLDDGGKQTAAFGDLTFPAGSDEHAYDTAFQPDGKLVVAGWVTNPAGGETDVALARFLPNGLLDTSFGTRGLVSLSLQNIDSAVGVEIQSDGKIVVAGQTGTSNVNCMVARFNPNGTLDTGFGFGGSNVLDFLGGHDYMQAMALAPDGKIVVAGFAFNGARLVFGAARFNANGLVDTSFDIDGKQLVEITVGQVQGAYAVVVQPDRKIVLGGHVNWDFALIRLLENGALDTSFGGTGKVVTGMGGTDFIRALALASNGRIFAAGGGGANADFALAQYNTNGTLAACPPFPCSSWTDGQVWRDWGGSEAATAIDLRSDGYVVAAGVVGNQLGWVQYRVSSTANPVSGSTTLPGLITHAADVQYQGVDKLVVAATQSFNGDANFALARFETTLDQTVDVASEAPPTMNDVLELGPNPTRGATRLTFDLAQAARAEVRIHDVAGRLVRVVDAGLLSAGRHQAIWDGRTDQGAPVGTGLYFMSLDVDGRRVGSKRVTMLR